MTSTMIYVHWAQPSLHLGRLARSFHQYQERPEGLGVEGPAVLVSLQRFKAHMVSTDTLEASECLGDLLFTVSEITIHP